MGVLAPGESHSFALMPEQTAIPPDNSFQPETRAAWRSWLEAHYTREVGVRLILVKKGAGLPRIDVGEAVEEALCFGWIDNKPAKLDARRSMLWFSPGRNGASGGGEPAGESVAAVRSGDNNMGGLRR